MTMWRRDKRRGMQAAQKRHLTESSTRMARIAVFGVGAIGGWVAARLGAQDHELSVLARGQTLANLNDRGLMLESAGRIQHVRVKASGDPHALGAQDILFLAVKAPTLPSLAATLAPLIGPDTLVVPMLNGVPWWFMGDAVPLRSVDPDGALAKAIPLANVVGCVVHASASCPAPGHVALRMADRLILGEPNGEVSDRVEQLATMLVEADLPAVASPDVRGEIWYKLWGNMTMNPISALTLATADQILDDPLIEAFILSVMAEAQAIGAKIGCPITQSGADRNAVTRKLGAFKTSMLQDVEGGRALELDALLAAPLEIAARIGIATPAMDTLFGLSRLMGKSRQLYGN